MKIAFFAAKIVIDNQKRGLKTKLFKLYLYFLKYCIIIIKSVLRPD